MVFKFKLPENMSREEIARIEQEQKTKILKEHTFLKYAGSSCVQEAEDNLHSLKTLMLTFEDPD